MKNKKIIIYLIIGIVVLGLANVEIINFIAPWYIFPNQPVKGKIIKTDYAAMWGIKSSTFPSFSFSANEISPSFEYEGLRVSCDYTKKEAIFGDVSITEDKCRIVE